MMRKEIEEKVCVVHCVSIESIDRWTVEENDFLLLHKSGCVKYIRNCVCELNFSIKCT